MSLNFFSKRSLLRWEFSAGNEKTPLSNVKAQCGQTLTFHGVQRSSCALRVEWDVGQIQIQMPWKNVSGNAVGQKNRTGWCSAEEICSCYHPWLPILTELGVWINCYKLGGFVLTRKCLIITNTADIMQLPAPYFKKLNSILFPLLCFSVCISLPGYQMIFSKCLWPLTLSYLKILHLDLVSKMCSRAPVSLPISIVTECISNESFPEHLDGCG